MTYWVVFYENLITNQRKLVSDPTQFDKQVTDNLTNTIYLNIIRELIQMQPNT